MCNRLKFYVHNPFNLSLIFYHNLQKHVQSAENLYLILLICPLYFAKICSRIFLQAYTSIFTLLQYRLKILGFNTTAQSSLSSKLKPICLLLAAYAIEPDNDFFAFEDQQTRKYIVLLLNSYWVCESITINNSSHVMQYNFRSF